MVYVGVREANGLGVMEVTLGIRWRSWEAFVHAFASCPAELRSPDDVRCTTTDGRRIALRRGRAFVNDLEIPIEDWPLYDSAFLRAAWLGQSDDAGRIVFGKDAAGRVELDFRDCVDSGK